MRFYLQYVGRVVARHCKVEFLFSNGCGRFLLKWLQSCSTQLLKLMHISFRGLSFEREDKRSILLHINGKNGPAALIFEKESFE